MNFFVLKNHTVKLYEKFKKMPKSCSDFHGSLLFYVVLLNGIIHPLWRASHICALRKSHIRPNRYNRFQAIRRLLP